MLGLGHRGTTKIRIGVIGATSFVAQAAVIPAIADSSKAQLSAVSSRSRAGELCSKYKVKGFDSYRDMVGSDDVDAVYIPLPNALHAEAIKFALSNGKHVLCEKPLAMSAGQARELSLLAKEKNLVLMEAYMTHYHPRNAELLKVLSSKGLIHLRHIHASFTGTLSNSDDYRWSPELGGGSIRDVGIYLLAPILEATGQLPTSVFGRAAWAPTGVDHSFSGLLEFKDGVTASIFSSFSAGEGQILEFSLERGRVRVENAFTPTPDDNGFEVHDRDGKSETFSTAPANSYLEMLNHFCDQVTGVAEPLRPLSETILVQRIIDQLLVSAENNRIEFLN